MYKTHIVMGNMRGGTSMVSGALRILGINMGDNIDPDNHEDLDLQHRHPLHMRKLIAEKNKKYDVWGWKDPMLIESIHEVLALCEVRNPVFYLVFRNPISVARTMSIREGWPEDWCLAYASYINYKLSEFFMDSGVDAQLVGLSYEECMAGPAPFIDKLIEYVDNEVNESTRQKAIDFIKPGYRPI